MKKQDRTNSNELINRIAKGMGATVVSWNTVSETIEKNITFSKIVDTSRYVTPAERMKLQEKSQIF